jgi:hypothetical protein
MTVRCIAQRLLVVIITQSLFTCKTAYGLQPIDTVKRDIVDIVVKAAHLKRAKNLIKKRGQKKQIYISFIPVSSEERGGSKVFVSSINSAFYLGNPDSTFLSKSNIEPSTNFKNQFGIGYGFNLWTKNNNWNVPGEFKITTQDQYTFGLGSNTLQSDRYRLSLTYIRCSINANQRLYKNLFYGGGLSYDRYFGLTVQAPPTIPSTFEQYGIGTANNSYSLGINANLLLDTRRNSINPSSGLYAIFSIRVNPSIVGNTNNWQSTYLDVRRYISLTTKRRSILALWAFYWASFGNVPYLNLPSTTTEPTTRSGRGYLVSRFRGKQMVYIETEYRFDFIPNGLLGGVVFCNAQSLLQPNTQQFAYINAAVGAGMRVKFNKNSNTNLTIDAGFGHHSFDFYIGLGEFF